MTWTALDSGRQRPATSMAGASGKQVAQHEVGLESPLERKSTMTRTALDSREEDLLKAKTGNIRCKGELHW